ncbi:chemotaxis protein CheC [Candidatus Riflebacteria bacterium]
MSFKDLTPEQLDAIQEMGNIGAGNAVTAMAQFFNMPTSMEVPVVSIKDFTEVGNMVGDLTQKIVSLKFSILGEINGYIIFLINAQHGKQMVKILLPDTDKDAPFTEMEVSCLMEIGNILSSSFVIALSNLTGKFLAISIPKYSHDMMGAVLDQTVAVIAQESDEILVFEANFLIENERIRTHLFLMIPPDEVQALLSSVGMA